MKKISFAILFLFFAFLINVNAQDKEITAASKSLIDLSGSKNYEKAAVLIIYQGDDTERNNKVSLDPKNVNELKYAKKVCSKISAMKAISETYEVGDVEKISDKEYKVNLYFVNGSQKLPATFSFLKTDKGYLLQEIN
ncbi:hypothetical protein APF79_08715 [bacterium BRH_c32]|nr:MAG: hypothetical protein APF79_08715 [bacterium BRH_c32]